MQNNQKWLLNFIFLTSLFMGNCLNAVGNLFGSSEVRPAPVDVAISSINFGGKAEDVKDLVSDIVGGAVDGISDKMNDLQKNMNNPEIRRKFSETSFNFGSDSLGAYIRALGWSFGQSAIYIAGGLALIATGYYGTKVLWGHIERKLKKPRVIIDQKAGLWYRMKRMMFGGPQAEVMILDPIVENYLHHVVKTTKVINEKIGQEETDIYYRNLLLAGPPGTGKTMFARQLAKLADMEFIEITGSSFFQEEAGIAAVDELFAWAGSCKGLMIFIDEADSLLPDRSQLKAGAEEYRIVNHFLNYLGQRSNKFMIVMATNHAVVFDEAMERRFDDYIEVPLPSMETRFKVLRHYRDTVLIKARAHNKAFVDSVNKYLSDKKLHEIAYKTDQLSNGHLQGIINAIKSDADVTKSGLVTSGLIDLTVERYINKHNKLGKHSALPNPVAMQLSAMPSVQGAAGVVH